MTIREALALGVLEPAGPRWQTPGNDSESCWVWLDESGRGLPWRWARKVAREGVDNHGGSGTLKACLWQVVWAG
jgi:hypothetical protein